MRQSTSITGCVRWSVGRSVGRLGNAFVRRSTRRTLLAYLALFQNASVRNAFLEEGRTVHRSVLMNFRHAFIKNIENQYYDYSKAFLAHSETQQLLWVVLWVHRPLYLTCLALKPPRRNTVKTQRCPIGLVS